MNVHFDLPLTSTCQELTADERANMEALLQRLLKDLNSGELDKEDLVQLASICAALTASQLVSCCD